MMALKNLQKRQVEIEVTGHWARMPAELEPELRPLLTTEERTFVEDQEIGFREHTVCVQHYVRQSQDLLVRAGLLPRLLSQLQQRGYCWRVHDQTCWAALQQFKLPPIPSGWAQQADRFAAVPQQPRGQLVVSHQGELVQTLAWMVDGFRSANVAIVLASNDQAERLEAALSRQTRRCVSREPLVGRGAAAVYLCQAHDMAFLNRDLWDVVIVAGARTAVSRQVYGCGLGLSEQLLYCVYCHAERLGRNERLRLYALCGPVVLDTTRDPPPQVRVELTSADCLRTRSQNAKHFFSAEKMLASKRNWWASPAGNHHVAQLATAAAHCDLPALWNKGLLLTQGEGFFQQWQSAPHVAILVENPEHARQLHKLLPEWKCLNLIPGRKRVTDLPSTFHRTIVTELFAHHIGLKCDVLVRATTSSAFPLENFARTQHAFLVEVANEGDVSAARAHLRDYANRGWTVDPQTAARYSAQ
jgi:hypothetical protein